MKIKLYNNQLLAHWIQSSRRTERTVTLIVLSVYIEQDDNSVIVHTDEIFKTT